MEHDKKIALVAHDNKKWDLVQWAKYNRDLLAHHKVYATGTTGLILEQELGFPITKLQSGPLGRDQQIGAKIADAEIDFLIFFWDPLEPQPHDPDVKALLRIAVVRNIPIACNRASADFMISSPLMDGNMIGWCPIMRNTASGSCPRARRPVKVMTTWPAARHRGRLFESVRMGACFRGTRPPNNRMHLTAALRLRRTGVQSQRGVVMDESLEPPPLAAGDAGRYPSPFENQTFASARFNLLISTDCSVFHKSNCS